MSENNLALPESLKDEVVKLLERYRDLKSENARLKHDLIEKQKEIEDSNAKIAELKADYNRLKIAKVYGWNEESKREANDKISRLVRDIDKCLAELNELEV